MLGRDLDSRVTASEAASAQLRCVVVAAGRCVAVGPSSDEQAIVSRGALLTAQPAGDAAFG